MSNAHEGDVMVEARPGPSLVVIQPHFPLHLLVVALDPPAKFCEAYELGKGRLLRQRGKPVLPWLSFLVGPLYE